MFKFIINWIRSDWAFRQALRYERGNAGIWRRPRFEVLKDWCKTKFETKKARAERLAREEQEREQMLKESNERLALLLLCESIGNEEDMNKACDLIKQMELVEGYK